MIENLRMNSFKFKFNHKKLTSIKKLDQNILKGMLAKLVVIKTYEQGLSTCFDWDRACSFFFFWMLIVSESQRLEALIEPR